MTTTSLIASLEKQCQSLPKRRELKEHEERIMLVCGCLTDKTKGAGQYILLEKVTFNKIVFKNFGFKYITRKCQKSTDHLWIDELILKNKMIHNKGSNTVISAGIIQEYERKNGTIDYGITPLPNSQLILGHIEFCLFNLATLSQCFSNVLYTNLEEIKTQIQISLELVREILSNNSSQGKMIRAIVDQEKL